MDWMCSPTLMDTSNLTTLVSDLEWLMASSQFVGIDFKPLGADGVAWRDLHSQLLIALSDGRIPVGTALPSERHLSEQLGLSRSTVKRAYDELRQTGWLSKGSGRGGSVIKRPEQVSPLMNPLKGFTQEMQELGKVASTKVLLCETVVDRHMATIFESNANLPLLHLVRVRFADDIAMTYERAWYNLEAAPNLRSWDGQGSAYAQLKASDLVFSEATQTIEAVLSSNSETEVFGFEAAQPCLLLRRHLFGGKDRQQAEGDSVLLEYAEGVFRGDRYTYKLPTALP
jgi:GntR family transcriptional regulator